jgi:hypothetical protein
VIGFALSSTLNPTFKGLVVFQKWRWPCLHCPSKGIAVDKQANDDVMHGDLGPVDGMPFQRRVGDCTSRRNGCHLPCLLDRLTTFSREERPEGSLPAFAWSDVAAAQPLAVPLQNDIRLLPPPLPAVP